ncbi:MAG TPA: uracil-DNA glycosylase [Alphaproteobacteria bacterium]|nr:uracil-DNA glycosylase [Alphaproteobacteria bacterium]
MEENLSISDISPFELLQFYTDIGVDEVVGDDAPDRTKIPEKILPMTADKPAESGRSSGNMLAGLPDDAIPATAVVASMGAVEAMEEAKTLAAGATTLEELRAALESFQGLAIKRTATQMVFADGQPAARIMFVGEAPGADEDRLGRPFVGVSGQLLDRMLASIGLSRAENAYISNVINWRPPGNRNPDAMEVALSMPFIQKHIALVKPEVIVFVGGVAAKAMLETNLGITRLRGRWMEYTNEAMQGRVIPAMCTLHPAYLLRSPQQKSLAWQDLQMIRVRLRELGVL